ncbi:enkurin-like [Heterocephalus glaber]|uniref:Enkurin-like n=1 Tax=Heterocephalus glaber TaxID=10181 RepID=A0AAX6QXD0_HETGA|nr:enkurin-like [Heterocephalus glaber]
MKERNLSSLTRRGCKNERGSSGERDSEKKKLGIDYGVTPEYIRKRSEELKKAQEEYDHYIQENLTKAAMKMLSDEERVAVLQGLKKNWEEVHKEFQALSVFIDSLPKKVHKQRLEGEMKQLEHDIGIIEKHKIIYIANKK